VNKEMMRIAYEVKWTDGELHIGKAQRIVSLNLESLGSPTKLGITRLLNCIKWKYPKVISIRLEIYCNILELEEE